MRSFRAILFVSLVCSVVPAAAQNTPTAPVEELHLDQTLDGPLGHLPETMFGVPCRLSSLDGVFVADACYDPNRVPVVSVYSYALGHALTYGELIDRTHRNFRKGGPVKTINEEPFVVKCASDAVGMRGIYQLDGTQHFTWSVSCRGNLTRVTVSVPDSAQNVDSETFEGEVMAKVFGPDRYVPDASATK